MFDTFCPLFFTDSPQMLSAGITKFRRNWSVLRFCFRMGSFTSAPKILNEDTQDADVELPAHMSREELLQHCHQQLENLPALVKRSFRRLRPQFGDTSEGVRVLQWNVLSRGTYTELLLYRVFEKEISSLFSLSCYRSITTSKASSSHSTS